MRRTWLLIPTLLLASAPVFGQSSSTDSRTLQDLLTEVRQLRHDLQTATLAAQKAQILIHRVDAEESIVRSLQERVDTTQSGLAEIRFDQRKRVESIKQIEDSKSIDETLSEEQKKELDDTLAQIKAKYDAAANDEQEAQAKLTEAEEQLRMEQAKLSELEDELDRLENSLEKPDAPQ